MKASKTHLVFLGILITMLCAYGISSYLCGYFDDNHVRDAKTSLLAMASVIAGQVPAQSVSNEDVLYLDALVRTIRPRAQCRISVINRRGKVIADSDATGKELVAMENYGNFTEIRSALQGATGIREHYSPAKNIDAIYAALPLKEGDEIIGILRVALPAETFRGTLRAGHVMIYSGLFLTIILALMIGCALVAIAARLSPKKASREAAVIKREQKETTKASPVSPALRTQALEMSVVNLKQQLDETIHRLSKQIKEKNVIVTNDLPVWLSNNVNKELIATVFANLIDNAVRFNRYGGSVKVFHAKADDMIKIVIEDTGIGIPEKDIGLLFLQKDATKRSGLSVVKDIVELHHGSVGAESVEGFGAKVWFTLPLALR